MERLYVELSFPSGNNLQPNSLTWGVRLRKGAHFLNMSQRCEGIHAQYECG